MLSEIECTHLLLVVSLPARYHMISDDIDRYALEAMNDKSMTSLYEDRKITVAVSGDRSVSEAIATHGLLSFQLCNY